MPELNQKENYTKKRCAVCDCSFNCYNVSRAHSCWCSQLPMIKPLKVDGGCLCQDCLRSEIRESIDQFVEDFKNGRCENIAPDYSNQDVSMLEGFDFYTENGKYVFTSWYHLKRGSCCGNGCRHCPY